MNRISSVALLVLMVSASTALAKDAPNQPKAIFNQTHAKVHSIRILAENPGRYIGWPSILRTSKDHLIAVFSGERTTHTSNDGKLQMVRSTDGGKTWTQPKTLVDTPLDDRDGGIVEASDGSLLITWFTVAWNESEREEVKRKWLGNLMIRSTDHGKTWSEPYHTKATTPHGSSLMSDGRLLVMGQYPHESQKKHYILAVEESMDHGKSWDLVSQFKVPRDAKMLTYDEPNLIEVEKGRVLVFFRDCFNKNPIRIAESLDYGRTWSKPWMTPMEGLPPHVIKLKDGTLVCVYAKRNKDHGQYACISRDKGKTWEIDKEIKLSAGLNWDLGYPCSTELKDGSILTVYYQQPTADKKPALMGTHWKLAN